ncbi:MAG: hypothetical protein M1831_006819 [Alyxoria varia]|nr:MAG: hypothetical protein M1831_006819 [Alyxoria varia]
MFPLTGIANKMLGSTIILVLAGICLALPSTKQIDFPFHLVARTSSGSTTALEFIKPHGYGWNGRRLIGPVSSNSTEKTDYTQSSTMSLKSGVLVAKAQLGSSAIYTTVREATDDFFITFVKDAKKHTGDLKLNDKDLLMKGDSIEGWAMCDYVGQKAIGWNVDDNKGCEKVELLIKKTDDDHQT